MSAAGGQRDEAMQERRDTIFALSSGAGAAGVSVVRVSGPSAAAIIKLLTDRSLPPPRRAVLRSLKDPGTGERIDSALVLWMPGPGSFTGEDVAEFHVHGSRAVVRRLLGILGDIDGTRLAENGEFTRRAFENGRLSLLEVEGLADLVRAETEAQRRQALAAAEGYGRAKVDAWREKLISVLSRLEASIDFCEEEDVATAALRDVKKNLSALIRDLAQALSGARAGMAVREGLRVVIAGPPNAGKSSLLNAMAGREAAIVSDMPGTTRDVLEVHLDLGGLPVILCDTAGLRDVPPTGGPHDPIEKMGQARARDLLSRADLVLWLDFPDRTDAQYLPEVEPVRLMRVMNKGDLLDSDTQRDSILERYDLIISAKSGEGLDALEREVLAKLERRLDFVDVPLVTRERQRQAIEHALAALREAINGLETDLIDVAAEHVRQAAYHLARLIGRVDVEDLLDSIFREFCIGK